MILAYYALLFLVAVPLLGLPVRVLAAAGRGLGGASRRWPATCCAPTVVDPFPIAEPGGAGLPVQLAVSGVYPVLTWTTYLLAGLAVGRLALRRRSVGVGLLLGGTALAVGARLAVGRAAVGRRWRGRAGPADRRSCGRSGSTER